MYLKLTLFIGVLWSFFSCLGSNMNVDCADEIKRISGLDYHIVITKVDSKHRKSWIEGVDNEGNTQKFYYYNIKPLDQIAEPNAVLSKDSGRVLFKITKNNFEYIIDYDCNNGGKVIEMNRF